MSSMSAAGQPGGIEGKLNRANAFFDLPVRLRSRLLLVAAALLLIPTFLFPLYNMTLYSNQFPDGLNLYIYSYSLEGGHPPGRDDLREINTLNHYIGMRPLLESDFSEFKWLPLIVGLFFILTLRAAVVGKMSNLVDVSVMFLYFGLFSLWSFYHRLSQYGHNLDPTAAVKIPPFSPPLFGEKQLANFTVYSYPGPASFMLVGFFLLVAVAVWLSRKRAGAR
jgi:copper chaperone NosL